MDDPPDHRPISMEFSSDDDFYCLSVRPFVCWSDQRPRPEFMRVAEERGKSLPLVVNKFPLRDNSGDGLLLIYFP